MNCCKRDADVENLTFRRIPRPPNAFMIFANANRKIMAQKYPTESNKDISKRLGSSWKSLDPSEKNGYFDKAKMIDNEHKRKYPNYVYNPKEARIRKAMREANRDRSIGNSPMLPRLGDRLPSHSEWTQPPQEDPLMMSPMNEMRRMDTSVCNYSMTNTENHYIPPIDVYNKMNSPPMVPNYMQPSPLAQLQQQQTEMWHPYQKNMPPRSLGTQFHRPMIQEMQQPTYIPQEPVQETPTNLIVEKPQESPVCIPQTHMVDSPSSSLVPEKSMMTPPLSCVNPHEPPKSGQVSGHQQHFLDQNSSMENGMQTTMMESKPSRNQNDQYLAGSAEASVGNRKNLEAATKVEPVVVAKKKLNSTPVPPANEEEKQNETSSSSFCPPTNFFTNKYRMEYITKHFASLPDYTLTTVTTTDGVSFPYASLIPNGYKSLETFLEVSAIQEEPILIPTDFGYIPVLDRSY